MPEYRRLTYAGLSDDALRQALAQDWRAYLEQPHGDHKDWLWSVLMDVKAVCQDRGQEAWWWQARAEQQERVRKERA